MSHSNRLREYNQKLALLEQLKQQVAEYENDPGFQSDMEFREKLKALQEQYGMSDQNVMEIVNPALAAEPVQERQGKRRQRTAYIKRYRNPNTGEEVETKSLRHKKLQEWIEEHGKATVKSWVVEKRAA